MTRKQGIYSKKQAGVIYKAIKEGKLEATKEQIKELYNWADRYQSIVISYGIQKCVECIIENKIEVASLFFAEAMQYV